MNKASDKTSPFRERLGCSIREATEVCPIGETKLRELMAKGRLKYTKLGKRVIINVPSLIQLIESGA